MMGLNGIEYFILFSYELKYELIFAPCLFVITQKRMPEEEINDMTVRFLKKERCKKVEVDKKKDDCCVPSCNAPSATEAEDGVAEDFTGSEGRLHKGILKIKATCANTEVRYPVDVDIIHDRCKVVDWYIWKLCKTLDIKPFRTRNKDTWHLCLFGMKKRGGKLVRDTKSYIFNRLDKDLDRILENFVEHVGSKELLARHEWNILNVAFAIYYQQRRMLENNVHTCADRTVSAFQPHVRPIDCDKAKAKTEFGAKVGASVYEAYNFIDHYNGDAYKERTDMKLKIELYKGRFDFLPTTLLANKIYINKANRDLLKDMEIRTYSKPLGRPPKQDLSPEYYRNMAKAIGGRNEVECSFGTDKGIYWVNNIRTTILDTARFWIGMCSFVKNVMKLFRKLCLTPFQKITFWLHLVYLNICLTTNLAVIRIA